MVSVEDDQDLTFGVDQKARGQLSMTMMDDYMDKNVDQYCTFEDNDFAHHDQSVPNIPLVDQGDTTADFFDMNDNRNAFTRLSTCSMGLKNRSGTVTSISTQNANKAISADSLNQVSDSIEAKYLELKHKMQEAKNAMTKKKTTKLLSQITKIANQEETSQQDMRKLSFLMGDDEVQASLGVYYCT